MPRERLVDLMRAGWLSPSDLVWAEGMADWIPAGSLDWLRGGPMTRTVHDLLDAARHPEGHPLRPAARARRPRLWRRIAEWDRIWERARPRHLVAVAGAFLAALGVAFLCIARSPLAWWLSSGGTVLVLAGMHAEVRRFLGWAAPLIARTWSGKRPAEAEATAPASRGDVGGPSPSARARDYDEPSGPVAQR